VTSAFSEVSTFILDTPLTATSSRNQGRFARRKIGSGTTLIRRKRFKRQPALIGWNNSSDNSIACYGDARYENIACIE
jgi:hypothetical protein